MKDTRAKNFLLGSVLAGSLILGTAGCSKDKTDKDAEKEKTEIKTPQDPYGNIALFEATRSKIKFALCFCENYYPYVYFCGKAWTTGHGLTVLYNADGTCKKVTPSTPVPTIEQSDVFKGRYMTHEILKDIKQCVHVPMDENTLIAACVLRYCIGGTHFRASKFVEYLNAGKTGAELAKTLTGWRQQEGVLNRCYFFAALMEDKITFADLLDLRAEGCYNLPLQDIIVHVNGNPKRDKDNFYEWDFSKLQQNLATAKKPRTVKLNLGRKKGRVACQCKMVKDVVPDYIWQEVSADMGTVPYKYALSANACNDSSYIAYQDGNYKKAVKFAKEAIKVAETDKQFGAAHYNAGISYLEMGKYGKAVKSLEKSIDKNDTRAAQNKLAEAKEKRKEQRGKAARNWVLGLGAGTLALGGAVYVARRRVRG